jgi:hypothetical protein
MALEAEKAQISKTILYNANVIASTLSSAGTHLSTTRRTHFSPLFPYITLPTFPPMCLGRISLLDTISSYNIDFSTVIIDEAAQATEISSLLPLRYRCKRLVLVGDPRQLPATILSRVAERHGLGRSLFERLERAEHEVVMLTEQYRMHPGK